MPLAPGIEFFFAMALAGIIVGAGFGQFRSDLPRKARLLPASYVGLAISAVPAIIFLLISVGGVTGFASGEWSFLQWIFAGLIITIAVFIVFGLPLLGGALIPARKRQGQK